MNAGLLMDLALCGLLVATIVYGIILNRRLQALRADRDQLVSVIAGLNEATARAVAGMEGLKLAADTSGRALQTVVDRARATVEDLTFLVERGEKAAERLEGATRSDPARGSALARATPAPSVPLRETAMKPVAPQRSAPVEAPPSEDPRALLKSLEGLR